MKKIIIILLALAIVFFVSYPFVKAAILKKNFVKCYTRKAKNVSIRNNYLFLDNIKLDNYGEILLADQIIFGNKFIYIIKDYCSFNAILAKSDDNSWIEVNRLKKTTKYIDNLLIKNEFELSRFSSSLKLDKSLLISITLINKECDLRIDKNTHENSCICSVEKLNKIIKNFESQNVKEIDKEQLKIVYEEIKNRN